MSVWWRDDIDRYRDNYHFWYQFREARLLQKMKSSELWTWFRNDYQCSATTVFQHEDSDYAREAYILFQLSHGNATACFTHGVNSFLMRHPVTTPVTRAASIYSIPTHGCHSSLQQIEAGARVHSHGIRTYCSHPLFGRNDIMPGTMIT